MKNVIKAYNEHREYQVASPLPDLPDYTLGLDRNPIDMNSVLGAMDGLKEWEPMIATWSGEIPVAYWRTSMAEVGLQPGRYLNMSMREYIDVFDQIHSGEIPRMLWIAHRNANGRYNRDQIEENFRLIPNVDELVDFSLAREAWR